MRRYGATRSTWWRLGVLLAVAAAMVVGVAPASDAGPASHRPGGTASAVGDPPYLFTLDAADTVEVWHRVWLTYSLTDASGQAPPRVSVYVIIDGRIDGLPGGASGSEWRSFATPGTHKVALLARQRSEDGTSYSWIAASDVRTVTVTALPAPGVPVWGFTKIADDPVTALATPAGFEGAIAADGSVSGTVATSYTGASLGNGVDTMVRLTDLTITGQLDVDGNLTATASARVEAAAMRWASGGWAIFDGEQTCIGEPWTFDLGGTYHDGDLDLLALNVYLLGPSTGGGCGALADLVTQTGVVWGPFSFLVRLENPPSTYPSSG